MSVADVMIGVLWAGLTAYAVLGGADFGAGVLQLLMGRGAHGRSRRTAIAAAMGPVWEANHVWLIFFVTGLLTAFPTAFSALGSALLAPAMLALVAIVLRGAALAFAAQLSGTGRTRPLRLLLGASSAVAPVMFGAIAGGLARERLVVTGGTVRAGGGLSLWLGPFQLAIGLLALAACTALAATFLTVEADGDAPLTRAFRRVALRATAASAGLAAAALPLSALLARPLFRGLTGRGLPAVLTGLVAFVVAVAALHGRRDRLARGAIVLATAALMWGWGLAQFPRLVGPRLTVAEAAAPPVELRAVAVALGAGAVLLIPALGLLYGAFRRQARSTGP